MSTRTVELISTPGCQQCKATERGFKGAGIEYSILDASQDPNAARAAKDLGYKQAPVVLVKVDGKLLTHWGGFRPDNIQALSGSGPAAGQQVRPRDIHAQGPATEPVRAAHIGVASL